MLLLKRSLLISLASYCLLFSVSAPIALLLGIGFRNVIGSEVFYQTHKVTKWLLQMAVVALAFGIDVNKAIEAGAEGFSITSLSVFAVLGLGLLITRWFHLERKLAFLISSGTAICGGSAIASMAPVINASVKEMSSALAVVFFLNALAVFIFPALGIWLQMSQHQFGLWCAVAIHDTSSVIGAASQFGNEALELATVAKLVRMLWILPLIVGSTLFSEDKKRVRFPWFVLCFCLVLFASAFFSIPKELANGVFRISNSLMSVVLFLMGASLTLRELKSVGHKPLVFGVVLWCFIGVGSAWVILFFY